MPNYVVISETQKCVYFAIMKMTTDRHLTFFKVPNQNGSQSKEGRCASTSKFPDDHSNRLCVMTIYLFSKWRPSTILNYKKNQNFCQLIGSSKLICVIMSNFLAIGQTIGKMRLLFDIHAGGYPPSSIFKCLKL